MQIRHGVIFNLNNRHFGKTPILYSKAATIYTTCFSIQKLCNLQADCIAVFRTALTVNSIHSLVVSMEK
jgi:hypothetical protein